MEYQAPPFDPMWFAPQPAKAVKVCESCGTSRTPQWREGPSGPKTLCNACGVKRCRQLRVLEPKRKGNTARAPVHPHKLQDTDDEADASYQDGPAPKRKALSKPGRSALWKGAGNDSESQETPDPSLSGGTAGLNSDSAEEDAWSPRAPTPKEGASKGPGSKSTGGPAYATVDAECTAAVNLLAMGMSHKLPHAEAAQPTASGPHRSHPAVVAPSSSQEAIKREAKPMETQHGAFIPGQPMLAPPQLQQLQRQQAMLIQMHELERQAAVAEAAVAAVAQVLAKKQAVATQARFELAKAQRKAFAQFPDTHSSLAPAEGQEA